MSFLRLGPVLSAALFALIGVFAACGGGSEGAPSEIRSSSIGQSGPASGGRQAPSFSVSTGGESTFSLDEHGGEVVLLYFYFPG